MRRGRGRGGRGEGRWEWGQWRGNEYTDIPVLSLLEASRIPSFRKAEERGPELFSGSLLALPRLRRPLPPDPLTLKAQPQSLFLVMSIALSFQ